MDASPLVISTELEIPPGELEYRASRSGGPGGQHVNTSSTRIELRWNVRESPSLNDEQRGLLLQRLASRLDRNGTLRLVSGARRSQLQNRETVTERLQKLVAGALVPRRPRRKTRPPRAAVERRLESKRRRSRTKQERRRPPDE